MKIRGPSRPAYLPVLDGMRGLAIVLVLWAHLPPDLFGPVGMLARSIVKPGYLGVDLFFVLSGFLITRLLLYGQDVGEPVIYFLARRALRIFPIYYLTLFVVSLYAEWRPVAWSGVYLSNYYFSFVRDEHPLRHVWSLCVEEHFYIVWPLVVGGLSFDSSRRVAVWGFVISAVGAGVITVLVAPADLIAPILYRGSQYRVLSLALGAGLAYREHASADDAGWVKTQWMTWGLAIGVGVLACGLMMSAQWRPLALLVGIASISFGLIVGCLLAGRRGGGVERILVAPPLRYLGRVSYGAYLFHFPIFIALGVHFFDPEEPPTMGRSALAVIVTVCLAGLSYSLVERRILSLKDRFRS